MKINIKSIKAVMTIGLCGVLLSTGSSAVLAYGDPGPAGPPVCNSSVPSKPWLYLVKNIKTGEVELKWDKVDNTSSWTLGYGVAPGKYIYGISNFGDSNSRSITVKSLPSGKYYFAIKANNGCMPGEFSNEWPVVVNGRAGSIAITKTSYQDNTPQVVNNQPVTNNAQKTAPKVTSAPAAKDAKPTSKVSQAPSAPETSKSVETKEKVKVSIWAQFANFFKSLFK